MGSAVLSLPPSVRHKVNRNLPLDLEQFMIVTYSLTTLEVGALMRCIMHAWMYGSLPENGEGLEKIMQISGKNIDTACITSRISSCIRDESTGYLKKRSEVIAKRLRRREICVNAIHARWEKVRRIREQKESEGRATLRIADVRENGASEQKEKRTKREKQTPVVLPTSQPPLPPSGGLRDAHVQTSEAKAKPGKSPGGDFADAVKVGEDALVAIDASRVARNGGNGHFKNGVNAPGVDPRFVPCREELFRFWRHQNPDLQICPWTSEDSLAMTTLLKGSPDLAFEQFKCILRHRAGSEINPKDPPRNWLGKAIKYSEGPLDRYGHPLKVRQEF